MNFSLYRSQLIILIIFIIALGFFVYIKNRKQLIQPIVPDQEKPIVVVIPSYNNEAYYKKNLRSVFEQQYSNYRVIYIDDNSKDKTYELVKKYIADKHQTERVQLIHNDPNRGAMANLYHTIHSCKDHEIVVTLDGDDWFAHEHVLARINQEYAGSDVWMTYGQFMFYPAYINGFCQKILDYMLDTPHLLRKYKWVASHPRTFYAWLFKQVKQEDLMYEGGFFSVTWDQAMMFPMLEMAGSKHSRFIPQVLYIYNQANPINDGRIHLAKVMRYEKVIRGMKPYARLANPITS